MARRQVLAVRAEGNRGDTDALIALVHQGDPGLRFDRVPVPDAQGGIETGAGEFLARGIEGDRERSTLVPGDGRLRGGLVPGQVPEMHEGIAATACEDLAVGGEGEAAGTACQGGPCFGGLAAELP